MARVLAIDFGLKRVGLAVTDPMQIIANGLTTVANKEVVSYLKSYCQSEEVEAFVVGEPKTLDNKAAVIEADIQQFIKKLNELFPNKPIYRIDERFTSSMAMDSLIAGGVKKKKRAQKELLDEVSATLILQSYMDSKKGF